MMMKRVFQMAMLGVLLLGFAGCSDPDKAFEEARQVNDIEAYQAFIVRYPESVHVESVRRCIHDLEWDAILRSPTVGGVTGFLNQYPDTPRQREANDVLANMAWDSLAGSVDIATLEGFIAEFPQNRHCADAKKRIHESEWNALRRNPSIDNVKEFTDANPESPHLTEAKELLVRLEKQLDFLRLNEALIPFLNNETPCRIVGICGKTSEKVAFCSGGRGWGILSGGFSIRSGVTTPNAGSKAVVEVAYGDAEIKVVFAEAAKVAMVESASFKPGALLEFDNGSIYRFWNGTWERLMD